MDNIIQKLAIESKQNEESVRKIFIEIKNNLLKEGCEDSDPRFLQYMVRRARKRLKIQESKAYVTFRQFFKEN